MANSAHTPDPVALTPAGPRRAPPRRQHVSHPGSWSAVLVVALAALCVLLAACSQSAPATSGAPTTAGASQPAAARASGYPVNVYFSKHSDDNPAAVFPVARTSPTLGVATYAIQQLIAGPTAAESAAGYYTTLGGWQPGASNCGGADFILTLNRKGHTSQPGTATLRFCRMVLLGGDLSGARIRAEIDATLLQFPTIHQVVILDPQGDCFDDLSGLNRCLGYPVRVYFSQHPDSDTTLSAVFPVIRVSPDLGVATFAITQLIAGPTPAERSDSYFSAFDGVQLRGDSVCGGPAFTIRLDTRGTRREVGTATLKFCTSFSFQGNAPMWQRSIAEITTTLLQFPNIQRVVLLTDRDTCYADESDGTGCLK